MTAMKLNESENYINFKGGGIYNSSQLNLKTNAVAIAMVKVLFLLYITSPGRGLYPFLLWLKSKSFLHLTNLYNL